MAAVSIRQQFQAFAEEINEHADRRERLIKCSRDITAASKKLIFLLHRTSNSDAAPILEQARAKEEEILAMFDAVGKDLGGHRTYRYKDNYTGGLQEWIEAISFMQFLQPTKSLITLEEVQQKLEKAQVHCSAEDYLLGLSDLTGELMRYGINAVGSAGIEESQSMVKETQEWVRAMQAEMSPLSPKVRNLGKKTQVTGQSLRKLEGASYTLALRGKEYEAYPSALKDALSQHRDTSNQENQPENTDY